MTGSSAQKGAGADSLRQGADEQPLEAASQQLNVTGVPSTWKPTSAAVTQTASFLCAPMRAPGNPVSLKCQVPLSTVALGRTLATWTEMSPRGGDGGGLSVGRYSLPKMEMMLGDDEPPGRRHVPQAVMRFVPLHAPGPFVPGYVMVQLKVDSPQV